MNEKIANILKTKLEALPFADKLAGMVRPMRIEVLGENNVRAQKTFPVSCDLSFNEVEKGKYKDLIPQSKYGSIIYFEDNGTTLTYRDRGRVGFVGRLNLVCWLNLNKVNCLKTGSTQALLNIISLLPDTHFSVDELREIRITGVSEVPKSNAIFSRYSYDEIKTQYLLHPFDYFSLAINVEYWVKLSCIQPLEIEPCTTC
jgi:hypothetical protein